MNKLLKVLGLSAMVSFTFVLMISVMFFFTSLLFNGFLIKSALVGFVGFTLVIFLLYLIITLGIKLFEKE